VFNKDGLLPELGMRKFRRFHHQYRKEEENPNDPIDLDQRHEDEIAIPANESLPAIGDLPIDVLQPNKPLIKEAGKGPNSVSLTRLRLVNRHGTRT